MSTLSSQPNPLWDIAGVDGLQVMKTLFGEQVDRIAPFQSLEAELDSTSCSVLRLCEGNFRLHWSGTPDRLESMLQSAATGQRVWVKQLPWLVSVTLPTDVNLAKLAQVAIAKPPFSLPSLALHCAAPARLETLSILVWRHTLQTSEILELHTAKQALNTLEQWMQSYPS
jgi:hypothetical protein